MTKEEAKNLWVERMFENAPPYHPENSRIDPDERYDWEGVAVGFFVALGFDPKTARNIYNTELIPEGYY